MLDNSKESRSFNVTAEQVYRAILEYLLVAKSTIVGTIDFKRIEATCGKFLSMHTKDARKRIIVKIKPKVDGTCRVEIDFDFSKSNIELCLEFLVLAIELVAIWLINPFIGFHLLIFTVPLILAMGVYYIQTRKQAFLSDLWRFLDLRLLPLNQLLTGKDFAQRFPSLDLNKERIKPFVFEDYWSLRNLYGKNRFGEKQDRYRLEIEQRLNDYCLVKTKKGFIEEKIIDPYKASKNIKIIEQLHKRKASPNKKAKIGYYFMLSFACLVSSLSLLWKVFAFPPIEFRMPLSWYVDLVVSMTLRSENDFITILMFLISLAMLLKWTKLANYIRSERSLFFLTASLFVLILGGLGLFYSTKDVWVLLMTFGLWMLTSTVVIVLAESFSSFQCVPERHLMVLIVISFPLFFVVFYLMSTGEFYDLSLALVFSAVSAIFLCFTGIPSDNHERDKVQLFLYDADPNSKIFPFTKTIDAPHWLNNRFYWVYQVIYRWLWETSLPPKRDLERVEVWVNAISGKIEWIVSDFHYRELWYQVEEELEFLLIWWDESFHTIRPLTEKTLVDLYIKAVRSSSNKKYIEFFKKDKKFKEELRKKQQQYTAKHPAKKIGRFFSGLERIAIATCAGLSWSKWRYSYGAYSTGKRRQKYDMKGEGHGATRLEEQFPCTRAHLVEVFGSLLNSEERKELLKHGGFREVGKIKRVGWKLSFDRHSKRWQEAVLNFVETRDDNDVYYTTVFEVDDKIYEEMLKREIGKQIVARLKRNEPIPDKSYRPMEVDSKLGKVKMFVIPEEGRELTPTTLDAKYVQIVKRGIEESYKGKMKEVNLKALYRAVRESSRRNEVA